MSATIRIPVDVHLVTLFTTSTRIVTREISTGRTTQQRRIRETVENDIPHEVSDQNVRTGIQEANRILQPADISFQMRSCTQQRAQTTNTSGRVTESEFHSLARQFPARNGVSMLVVRNFHNPVLGGSAVQTNSACIVKKSVHPGFGYVIAHEFGHLLNLPHVEVVNNSAIDNHNLMYPGARAGHQLTADQIATARSSSLATRMAGAARAAAR